MDAYTLAKLALAIALLAQTLVTAFAIEGHLRRSSDLTLKRSWLAVAIASTLLALHHGYTLELALRTGLYDTRQAVLAGAAALFFALGIYGFRRRQA
jgi:NhaP-type Na+/H+ and K+/H+ antiporter